MSLVQHRDRLIESPLTRLHRLGAFNRQRQAGWLAVGQTIKELSGRRILLTPAYSVIPIVPSSRHPQAARCP
ncbi:hypothetical protein [Paenibacillus lautus]|uniref:hypothetical protein n=1 Tax=Paenibacillus lautus TaxID=1401 RepID=UPI003D9AA6DF